MNDTKPNVEDNLILNEFQCRPYQAPLFDAIFNRGIKRIVCVLPRRAGKDCTLWNAAIRWALMKPTTVYYVGDNYGSVRKFIWDAIGNDGKKFLDYIPERLIMKKNESEMKIVLKNNSIIQCVSGESHATSMRGTNPSFVVLSEFAYYKDPTVLDTVTPILAANGGVLVLASTPQGKNTFYTVYKMAQDLPDWWTYHKTVKDTKHISEEALAFEKKRMSPEMYEQEYMCSFDRGVDGTIFGKSLMSLRREGHITSVVWQPGLLVHVCMDIGLSKGNATTIIWFQIVGDNHIINIIDCYSSENLGLDYYAGIIASKPYKYGVYLAPHDLAVREWGAGAVTRYEKARQLDITFTILDQHLLADQIENTLTHFSKVWIDEVKCKSLIDALENYYRQWDEQKQVYGKPVHNWACFVANTFVLTRNGKKKIIDIEKNDQILTLYGWKPCNKAKLMKRKAALVEVIFQDGTKVKCTPEHKFLTANGWISAENLTMDTVIRSSLMQSHSTSMEKCIEYGRLKNTSQREVHYCTEMYGLMPSVKYQISLIFIMLTRIISTITYGIYSVCQKMSIGRYQGRTIKDSVSLHETRLWNGTSQMQQYYGEKEMLSDKPNGWYGSESLETVRDVRSCSTVLLDQMECSNGFVGTHADCQHIIKEKEIRIEQVNYLHEKEDVYCINVPDIAHFSLENGAIVHNSNYASAFMGIFLGLHHCATGRSGDEYTKLRQEALDGNQYGNLPRIFRKGMM